MVMMVTGAYHRWDGKQDGLSRLSENRSQGLEGIGKNHDLISDRV
jgi:hypothetical protein